MKSLVLPLALSALATLPFRADDGPRAALLPASPNLIGHELVVVYDWSGADFAGPVDLSVEVYGDGVAKIAGGRNGVGESRVTRVGADEVRQLVQDLRTAGAWRLSDQPGTYDDIPLKTLTVLRGGEDKRAHGFSYWAGIEDYQPVELTMQLFVSVHFPGF